LFSISLSGRFGHDTADFDAQRFTGHSLEWRGMAGRRPELELDVARRAQLQQIVVATIVKFESGHGLRVAAIQALREPKDRGERTNRPARAPP
jgi:hypothetical protein